jgi:muramoyltetrapeptide carboxypeptidase
VFDPRRRGFNAMMAAALLLPLASRPARARSATHMTPLIKPPRLARGDVVGLVAPGGYTTDAAIEQAVRHIEALGLCVKQGTYLREVWGNYGGTVAARIADLHAMFRDPQVKAIWAIRGGSGCISLLRHLDYRLIRTHPKILLGYSDITALHLAIHRHAGLVTFHGPVASSTPSDYSTQHLLAVLMEPRDAYTIPMSVENDLRALDDPWYATRTVHGGVAEGRLIGGNLSLVSALAGTPYAADFTGSLLFIEEVNEEPYRIDRWLTQLDLAVGLDRAAGVMVGICENCGPQGDGPSLTLDETLDVHLRPLRAPAVTGYSFGHIRHQFTLPVGVRARLDTAARTVTLLEPGVS